MFFSVRILVSLNSCDITSCTKAIYAYYKQLPLTKEFNANTFLNLPSKCTGQTVSTFLSPSRYLSCSSWVRLPMRLLSHTNCQVTYLGSVNTRGFLHVLVQIIPIQIETCPNAITANQGYLNNHCLLHIGLCNL